MYKIGHKYLIKKYPYFGKIIYFDPRYRLFTLRIFGKIFYISNDDILLKLV